MTDIAIRRELDDLDAKYHAVEGEFLFTGVQALVRVPLDVLRADRRRGLRTAGFISGYQGSPLGGFDKELLRQQKLLDSLDIVFRPGLNEELGATAVMGSQMVPAFPNPRCDGVLGVWYGKAPGLDRASDAIRHAAFGGTSPHGGALALVGDDPSCKSSTVASSSEFTMHDILLPTLVPGTVQEVIDFGLHGAALSRASGLWAGIRIVTSVADALGTAEVHPGRVTPVIPTLDRDGVLWQPRPNPLALAFQSPAAEREIVETRMQMALRYVVENPGVNQIVSDPDNAWIGIVASGRTFHEVVEALHLLGLGHDDLARMGVRLLRVGMVSPLDPGIVRRFARGLTEVIVVEEKRPFLELFVKDALYGMTDAPRVIGKVDEAGDVVFTAAGALEADSIVRPIAARLQQRISAEQLDLKATRRRSLKLIASVPDRQPYFCSGCPHSTSTKVPDGMLVGAGIGCHGMVAFMPEDRVGEVTGITQMGGEGVQWVGIEPFVAADHIVQNVGDGTFFHSASLAVRAAVAAGSNITYKLLYNSTVAMTGGQDAPGAMPVPKVAAELLLEGVARVLITSDDPKKYKGVKLPAGVEVWPRERILEAQTALASVKGVTVLIHDQQCAAEKRRDRKRGRLAEPAMRIVINERVCEGCGDCGDVSNCLSVQPVDTEFGRKTRIDQSSCNKDYSCLNGDCPSFLTVEPVTRRLSFLRRKPRSAEPAAPQSTNARALALEEADLPEPTLIVPSDEVTVRMPGIGGTGVVTVAQIIATAATLDGRYVWGLDQTGLAQKAGPVVSDLRISNVPLEGTNQTTSGRVDLYLAFDLLVALDTKNLSGASPERTVAVVSTSRTPTGEMVTRIDAQYPATSTMLADLDAVTRHDDNVVLDAAALAEGLFGRTTTANVLAVGAAYQRGCLPLSAGAIEHAIELNGAAVEANKLAFRWGRMLIADPERVEAALVAVAAGAEPAERVPADVLELFADLDRGELGRLLRVRVPDLVDYQNRRYAERYVDLVRRVARAESKVEPASTALAEGVARGLYKLMAYKDEYEVARLHIAGTRDAVIAAVGGDVRVTYNLHPPMLRSLGLDRKIKLGSWFTVVLKVLARAKFLRPTRFNPFRYAKVRRIERSLVAEYRKVIERLTEALRTDNLQGAIRLADLPDMVRGYEEIKLNNVERYRAELNRQLLALSG